MVYPELLAEVKEDIVGDDLQGSLKLRLETERWSVGFLYTDCGSCRVGSSTCKTQDCWGNVATRAQAFMCSVESDVQI